MANKSAERGLATRSLSLTIQKETCQKHASELYIIEPRDLQPCRCNFKLTDGRVC